MYLRCIWRVLQFVLSIIECEYCSLLGRCEV